MNRTILIASAITSITIALSLTIMGQAMASPTEYDCRFNISTNSISCGQVPQDHDHVAVKASWDGGKPFVCHADLSNPNPTGDKTGTLGLMVDSELEGCSAFNTRIDYKVTGKI